MEYVWIIAFLVFIGIELLSMGLTSIWFALGAIVAWLAYLAGATIAVQMILFVLVSVVIMLLVRPFALRFVNNNTTKTNVEAISGENAMVVETINNIEGNGTVVINGLEWTARSEDGAIIENGEIVTVVRIEGVKAIVKKST